MAEEDTAESDSTETGIIAKLKSNKKLMIGVASLLLIIIGGGVYYFILAENPKEEKIDTEQKDDLKEESVTPTFEKANKYPLKTFFFPIKSKNSDEPGHFLVATPIFIISNAGLAGQISKDLNNIRKTIYNIFLRESHKNLTTNIESSKERVKKNIITKVNQILPVGTGVVTEVYFSEFIVK